VHYTKRLFVLAAFCLSAYPAFGGWSPDSIKDNHSQTLRVGFQGKIKYEAMLAKTVAKGPATYSVGIHEGPAFDGKPHPVDHEHFMRAFNAFVRILEKMKKFSDQVICEKNVRVVVHREDNEIYREEFCLDRYPAVESQFSRWIDDVTALATIK
jgi:hypothetical protein